MRSCESCRHWLPYQPNGVGTCKRFPPTPLKAGDQALPQTVAHDWCGEHSPRED